MQSGVFSYTLAVLITLDRADTLQFIADKCGDENPRYISRTPINQGLKVIDEEN